MSYTFFGCAFRRSSQNVGVLLALETEIEMGYVFSACVCRRGSPNVGVSLARARKLAAMQSNASTLEEDRKNRLAQLDEQERKRVEEDAKIRSDKARFLGQVQRQAGATGDLKSRLQGRSGLLRDED